MTQHSNNHMFMSSINNIDINNLNFCPIELKWVSKITKIWYDFEVNTNNGVKWKIFIVSKKVEQINDYLYIHIRSQIK